MPSDLFPAQITQSEVEELLQYFRLNRHLDALELEHLYDFINDLSFQAKEYFK